jgi:hypothetical protein
VTIKRSTVHRHGNPLWKLQIGGPKPHGQDTRPPPRVQQGQIVLRKAVNPGYGVELSGGSKSDLLQVRAVGIGVSAEARDASRDRDLETIWCGEFDRLKAQVAKAGGDVSIEFARPVGQFPLKIVSDPAASHEI